MSPSSAEPLGALFVGAGPAGLAPLIWAARKGVLPQLVSRGLTVVEKQANPGAGAIGDYGIGSDTLAETFLECLSDSAEHRLAALREHETVRALKTFHGRSAPLPLVATFLTTLGETMTAILRSHGAQVLCGWSASTTFRQINGSWRTRLLDHHGHTRDVTSDNVVIATGAWQNPARLGTEAVGGIMLAQRLSGRLLQSGEVLRSDGAGLIRMRLRDLADPRIVVIGGSHSALACANLLLNHLPDLSLRAGALTLMHRQPLRLFYPDVPSALADGYAEFDSDDVCPLTGRVFRLAGFRLDARTLVRQALHIGNAQEEPRLKLHRLQPGYDAEAWQILDSSNLVIAAFGYRPHALPVCNDQSQPIPLAGLAGAGRNLPLVDRACRVLDATGSPVRGLFGIGLAAGFVPNGALGGEASFSGQTNGLWLWQNDVGALIIRQLLEQQAWEEEPVDAAA